MCPLLETVLEDEVKLRFYPLHGKKVKKKKN